VGAEAGSQAKGLAVKACCNSQKKYLQEKKDANSEKVSPAQVRQACEDLLLLAASTIPHMGKVLWPFLLEMVIPRQYSGALPVVARCIGHLASSLRAASDPAYALDWDRLVNLPRPQVQFVLGLYVMV
jgi:hypothetical protein